MAVLFSKYSYRLLAATPEGEDPVAILQAAARDHIPVNPKSKSLTWALPSHDERPSIDEVIQEIQDQQWYRGQIADRRTFDAREAREGRSHVALQVFKRKIFAGSLDEPLSETIQEALRDARKINSLYLHQAAAINAIAKQRHVIVSTSTASGKSVIYQVLDCLLLKAFYDLTRNRSLC